MIARPPRAFLRRMTQALPAGLFATVILAVVLLLFFSPKTFENVVFRSPAPLFMLAMALIFMMILLPRNRAFRIRSDMSLPPGITAIFLLLALCFGSTAYEFLQKKVQSALLEAVQDADVIADMCMRTPGLNHADCRGPRLQDDFRSGSDQTSVFSRRSALSDLAIWQILTESGIIEPAQVPTPASLARAGVSDQPLNLTVDFLRLKDRTVENSFGLLTALSRLCRSGSGESESKESAAGFYQTLAISVAGLDAPSIAAENLPRRAALSGLKGDFQVHELPRAAFFGNKKLSQDELFAMLDLHRLSMPAGATDQEILTSLLFQANAFGGESNNESSFGAYRVADREPPETTGSYVTAGTGGAALSCPQYNNPAAQARSASAGAPTASASLDDEGLFLLFSYREKLALYVLGRIRLTDEVRNAKLWAMLFTGYEQAAMLVLFLLAVMIAVLRIAMLSMAVNRKRFWFADAARPVRSIVQAIRSSRWPLRYIAVTLPAIGFMGTARGIMLSLSGAEEIVWATTVNDRAAAIGALATNLGLSFTTTLIALVLGILLSLLIAVESRLAEMAAARVAPDLRNAG